MKEVFQTNPGSPGIVETGFRREIPEKLEPYSTHKQFIKLWKKLPITLSKFIGPPIRKHISL